jgi:hypothetical protein
LPGRDLKNAMPPSYPPPFYTRSQFSNEDLIDETVPIINKPKHPKKVEYKEQNGRTHFQEDKKTTEEGRTRRGTSSS